jgi:signal peptidase I
LDQEQPHVETSVTAPLHPLEDVNTLGPDCTPASEVSDASTQGVRPKSHGEGWIATIQSLLVTVTIAVFVITFIVQAFEIPSPSMERTLLIGDYLLVDKTYYGPPGIWNSLLPYRPIHRGEIVVFHYPRDPKQHFVKRVIGLPGDRIRLRHKRVYVNGTPLVEPYTIYNDRSEDAFRDDFPNGSRLQAGIDSSWYIQLDRLVEDGQLIVPADHYFVMGDNRDDSSDSRYWGFVPKDNVVGRPLLIYFSLGSKENDSQESEYEAEVQDGKLSLRILFSRIAHDIRWRRVLRLIR